METAPTSTMTRNVLSRLALAGTAVTWMILVAWIATDPATNEAIAVLWLLLVVATWLLGMIGFARLEREPVLAGLALMLSTIMPALLVVVAVFAWVVLRAGLGPAD